MVTDTMLSTAPTLIHTADYTRTCVNTRAMQSVCDSFSQNIFQGLMGQPKRFALYNPKGQTAKFISIHETI